MAGQDIVQNMIAALGQSQSQRLPSALAEHYVDIDDSTSEDVYVFIKKFSSHVNFYQNNPDAPSGDWQNFFTYSEGEAKKWLAAQGQAVPPHIGLLDTFIELLREPKDLLNHFTARHLQFYYRDILHFNPLPPVVDKAHVVVQLKKNAPAVALTPQHQFSAGKDATGKERVYAPTDTTIINHSEVSDLSSIYSNAHSLGKIHLAPIANSADGVGGDLDKESPKWSAFGNSDMPLAEIGFAIASPLLYLQEGVRTITADLTLSQISANNIANANLSGAFNVYLTAPKQWLGPISVTPSLLGSVLRLQFSLSAEQEAVVNYSAAIHGHSFHASAPVMQVLLNNDKQNIGPATFNNLIIEAAKISVDVSGVTTLKLENDTGSLNPKKAFQPFSAQPERGSRFIIGSDEVFSKRLQEVKINLLWQVPATNLAAYYATYKQPIANNSYFTAGAALQDGEGRVLSGSALNLFNATSAASEQSITLSESGSAASSTSTNSKQAQALFRYRSRWSQKIFRKWLMRKPVLHPVVSTIPAAASQQLVMHLDKSFLHRDYRKETIANTMAFAKGKVDTLTQLNEPYTPTVQRISLDYKAYSANVGVSAISLNEFASDEVQYFHIGPFGQMREHAYQRSQFDFVKNNAIPLMPQFDDEGALHIGLTNLNPGESCSLLFQVAEGSGDPDLPQQVIRWSVLCDNYWKDLSSEELIADTTNHLLTSGIIKFVIPSQATTPNSLLPTGKIWLRASVQQNVEAVCKLVSVNANAIQVSFINNDNAPSHLVEPLASGSIAKLKTPVAEIKKIEQPYASFGAKPAETTQAFNTRVAERLRHKNRAVTSWDIERIVLASNPSVHKVKAIPHSRPNNWKAPGNVLVVVVPKLNNQNAVNPLQPKVSGNTLSKIKQHLQALGPMQVQHHVVNPTYQQVQMSLQVKFKVGFEFNFYSKALKQALIRYLSPWAYGEGDDIEFGGKLYKSALLDFIEELDYVDYLTDVKLYTFIDSSETKQDVQVVTVQSPDSILVSAADHTVLEYQP